MQTYRRILRKFEIDGNQSFDVRVEALNIPIHFFKRDIANI